MESRTRSLLVTTALSFGLLVAALEVPAHAQNAKVEAAAKRLGLHRRTLQRKLQKRPSGLS